MGPGKEQISFLQTKANENGNGRQKCGDKRASRLEEQQNLTVRTLLKIAMSGFKLYIYI